MPSDVYVELVKPRRGPNRTKKGRLISERVKREVDQYCVRFANLVRPVPEAAMETYSEAMRRGTPGTGHFLALWDGDEIYGKDLDDSIEEPIHRVLRERTSKLFLEWSLTRQQKRPNPLSLHTEVDDLELALREELCRLRLASNIVAAIDLIWKVDTH